MKTRKQYGNAAETNGSAKISTFSVSLSYLRGFNRYLKMRWNLCYQMHYWLTSLVVRLLLSQWQQVQLLSDWIQHQLKYYHLGQWLLIRAQIKVSTAYFIHLHMKESTVHANTQCSINHSIEANNYRHHPRSGSHKFSDVG